VSGFRRLAAALALAALPSRADAHLVNTRLGDFYDGALHPLIGFDFVLPWLAFAILAAFQGKERGRWLIGVFPLGLLAGALLSQVAPNLQFLPILNVGAFAIVGLLLAMALILPFRLFIALSVMIALVHGYENGLK